MTPIGDPMTRPWEEFVEDSPYWLNDEDEDDSDLEAELARDEAAS